jgi:hypothetical protein
LRELAFALASLGTYLQYAVTDSAPVIQTKIKEFDAKSCNAVGIWRQILATLQNLTPDPATPSGYGARF